MALYNEILVARYARSIQKLFGMKGAPPVRQLGGDITPVIPFEDSESAELRYLNSWSRFGRIAPLPAGGVGNLNQLRLRNPAGSNAIIVIELVSFTSAAADNFKASNGASAADLANAIGVGPGTDFDGRNARGAVLKASQAPSAVDSSLNNPFGIFCVPSVNTNVQLISDANQEIPITPGFAVHFIQAVSNQACTWSFWWRERSLEESEAT